MKRPSIPRATYRLQFRQGFGFTAACEIVPYLASLGVSHVYASPIFKAKTGSPHGYDLVDFNRLDPVLGSAKDFEVFVTTLRRHDMGLIADFVPNHMAATSENPWWQNVLAWGRRSPYARFFDIDWRHQTTHGSPKLILPVLGKPYGQALEAGELLLTFEPSIGEFAIDYHGERFPIAPGCYGSILRAGAEACSKDSYLELIKSFERLEAACKSRESIETLRQKTADLKSKLSHMSLNDPEIGQAINHTTSKYRGDEETPNHWCLHELISRQAYRLAFWRLAASEINYRRFFDINELVGLRMERRDVFDAAHELLLRLIVEGKIQGVRLDHIDGLADPAAYCRRLVARVTAIHGKRTQPATTPECGQLIYIVAEKILAQAEQFPNSISVAGTTGYDFMNAVNGLFVDYVAERSLTDTYQRFTGQQATFREIAVEAKRQILQQVFGGELEQLAGQLHRLAHQSRRTIDLAYADIRKVLREIIVGLPSYRTYVDRFGISDQDRRYLVEAIEHARSTDRVDEQVYEFVQGALNTDLASQDGYARRGVLAAISRFQQLTGAIMAKAVEDTALYRYVRLLSLNEVGGDPAQFGLSPSEFHRWILERQRSHPHTMCATATHDHKRGEDVRARLSALTEIPADWHRAVCHWRQLNTPLKFKDSGRMVPSANDEYLLYQTMIGAWPTSLAIDDEAGLAAFRQRIIDYMIKAVREAKLFSSWMTPDQAYEAALRAFVGQILNASTSNEFLNDFMPLQRRVALIGAVNGLSQTLIKLTVPGVPDIYQGTEVWDLSLVDPDNRRAVAFKVFSRTAERGAKPQDLICRWHDGQIKQHVIKTTLTFRQRHPELFAAGEYYPLEVVGPHANKVVAFLRRADHVAAMIVVPRLIGSFLKDNTDPIIAPQDWQDTYIISPFDDDASALVNQVTARLISRSSKLYLKDILVDLPIALLSLKLSHD